MLNKYVYISWKEKMNFKFKIYKQEIDQISEIRMSWKIYELKLDYIKGEVWNFGLISKLYRVF